MNITSVSDTADSEFLKELMAWINARKVPNTGINVEAYHVMAIDEGEKLIVQVFKEKIREEETE